MNGRREHHAHGAHGHEHHHGHRHGPGAGAIDPVCGMTVDPATAISHTRGQETFYFCSRHCHDKFAAEGSVSGANLQPAAM